MSHFLCPTQAVEPTIVALVGIGYLQKLHLNTNCLNLIIMRKPKGKSCSTRVCVADQQLPGKLFSILYNCKRDEAVIQD
jgi:hypothetical protein